MPKKDIRLMEVMEDIDNQCGECLLLEGCIKIQKVDKEICDDLQVDYDNAEKMLCPRGMIVINGIIYRSIKPSDIRRDIP